MSEANSDLVTVGCRIPAPMVQALDAVAGRMMLSRADVLRFAVRDYVRAQVPTSAPTATGGQAQPTPAAEVQS